VSGTEYVGLSIYNVAYDMYIGYRVTERVENAGLIIIRIIKLRQR